VPETIAGTFLATRLDTRILRTLVAVQDYGTLSKAAEALGVTQSALSHQIREAERQCGAQLFRRVGRRLHLTPLGDQLQDSARRIVAEIARAEDNLENHRHGMGPVVRVSGGAYGCHEWMPRYLAQRRNEGVEKPIELLDNAIGQPMFKALTDGKVDVILTGGAPRDRRVEAIPVFADELMAVMAPNHALRSRSHVEAADFGGQTYLTYSTVSEMDFEGERLFRPSKVSPKRFLRVGTVEAIIAMVAEGLGLSILSAWAVRPAERRGRIKLKRVTRNGLDVTWNLCIRAAEPADSATRLLAEDMAQWWADHRPNPLRAPRK
jgi:LysR family transcriptional regulator for metE and metH